MSFVRTLDDIEKLGAPIVVATMVLTFAAMAFLLVRETTAPVGVTAPVVVPSYQAAEDEVPSVPVAPYHRPDDPGAGHLSASVMPEPSPAPPRDVAHDPEDPRASEQRVLRSRRALETVDARELLRQANMPR